MTGRVAWRRPWFRFCRHDAVHGWGRGRPERRTVCHRCLTAEASRRAVAVGRSAAGSPLAAVTVAAAVVVLSALPARGAEISFSISSHETYVGAPITIDIRIENAETHDPPEFPEIDGADVDGPNVSDQTFTSITMRGTVVRTTYVYSYTVTPRRAGVLTIPSIRVVADGESSETNPTQVTVHKSEAGDLLFVKLLGDRKSVYVGEPIDVTLEIWLKPFGRGRYRLDYNDMWRCIDKEHSTWGPFAEVLADTRNVRVRQSNRRGDDGLMQTYNVYSLRHRVWPERPGAFDAGGVTVLVDYPLQIRRNRFSLLGPPFVVTDSRPISATVETSDIIIKSLPSEGRPDVFRGAVGQYTMDVAAAPTEAAVGDPITLTMVIRGSGRLDTVQAPPLATQESLTADFRVPDEPLAGVVENGAKTFSQSIRARRDDVTQIPPIAFAYFDPTEERYVTIHSDPIRIKIKQSARLPVSRVVETADPLGDSTSLTLMDQGLMANYDDIDALLASGDVSPGWGTMAMGVVWPVAYVGCLVIRRRRDRLRADTGFARRRSAHKRAMAQIRRCERLARGGADAADSPAGAAAAGIAGAVTQYIADRCNLPPGGVTRADAVRRLREHDLPDDLVASVDDLLAECESAQYAGTGQTTANDVVRRARRCVDELERRRF